MAKALALVGFVLLSAVSRIAAQSTVAPKPIFLDTTGGYGYLYLSASCINCTPKGLVFQPKFILLSGFYKTKDIYSATATRSIAHFEQKFRSEGYFIDKSVDIWRSPYLFTSFEEASQHRNDLVEKLKKDNYKVVLFESFLNAEHLKPTDQ